MKKSIILFCTEETFLAPGITAHAGKPVYENGLPFRNGFPSDHHYNLNIPDRQGHFTCPLQEYFSGTQVYGKVVFILSDKGSDPVSGEISLWS